MGDFNVDFDHSVKLTSLLSVLFVMSSVDVGSRSSIT